MITKQEFELVSKKVASNLMAVLPRMIDYKSYVQRSVLEIATPQEIEDVRDSRLNQGMIDKLCRLAKGQWKDSRDAVSLYCAAMAVGTIIKEYEWGLQYVCGNGLWEMADRIQNA